ncbi:MAG: tRNA preQ1(34) S-adenosylmethionine ribosyltransferase-isomerase QueA [Gammaproteobacteria bacterium]|nr:tRNA preQ1(34) S-adenosylmethionine ribosyltransferase-isomerase QueA [Gammaproteobacteria bacterium]
MKRSDFHFELPEDRIAQFPLAERVRSRLLAIDPCDGRLEDGLFSDLPRFLRAGDLLVFNDTRVIPARLFGRKETGGRVEVMVERYLGDGECLAQLRVSKPPRAGSDIELDGGYALEVVERRDAFYRLRGRHGVSIGSILAACGHMPLPPYIQRADADEDRERYQTVYARREGAVAAPTAGLHFDREMMARLSERNIETAFVTLHVGAGTFQSPRHEDLGLHRMHREFMEVDETVCEKIRATRACGGRVIAVGTTAVRCLETASAGTGAPAPYRGETDLFILPGYRFRAVDALLTNFHMPESTLLMLVSAFAGRELIMAAYRHAIDAEYRFYSYGDAMFIKSRANHDLEGMDDAL